MHRHWAWVPGLFAVVLLAACGAEPAAQAPADEAAEPSPEEGTTAPSKATTDIAVGEFRAADRMSKARVGHVAVLLGDGRVMAVGGLGKSGFSSTFGGALRQKTAEIYDPSTGDWNATASMAKERESHTGHALRDGRVMVIGGADQRKEPLKATEIWDPVSGEWSAGPKLKSKRRNQASVRLPDGRVVVAGGTDDIFALVPEAEIFDPDTNTWSPADEMSQARALHTATVLDDGRVLVVGGGKGGVGVDTEPFDSAEIWSPDTNQWTSAGTMSDAHAQHTATRLDDGRVLVIGGSGKIASAEIYDPQTGTWSSAGMMSAWRAQHTATLLPSGQVLVAGGIGRTDPTTELFDPVTGTWQVGSKMTHPRYDHTSIVLKDGRVLLAGGQTVDASGERKTSNTAEIYEP